MTTGAKLPSSSFEAFVNEGQFDVAVGAALLARDEYPTLSVESVLAELRELARPLESQSLELRTATEQAKALQEYLCGRCGYSGNETDYYDPKNSLLPDVLARKTGIPISLALVYVEVATRAGVIAHGVAFPGHFLVRIDRAHETVFVDPFFGGKILTPNDLEMLLRKIANQANADPVVKPEMLEAANGKTVLFRWLMNLRGVHLQRGDYARAMVAIDRIIMLEPNSAWALRDRGLLAARLGAVSQAQADLTQAANLTDDTELTAEIRQELERLKTAQKALN